MLSILVLNRSHADSTNLKNVLLICSVVTEYLTLNFWLITIFFLELVFLMVSGLLFCAHTYLMVSNQTSWEFMARSRITYLRDLGDENPFDRYT